ncbi:hypothetical protein AR158_c111L [Paramecium bursaria Chlorella virus AR158]|uniref:hypothetical protein n=1 Tax=Paramecium bursaria Chlorella virus AR158 TaxID=380598 RepID=UPI00015AA7B5|nr:hypothetical protein AR158_c111L [Paramecium bursaria Chlorella virus AR158]ABU43657.1 hypothetical protein AR158_c111L [Paramecium bursaria Chlorella virus AR158]
MLSFPRSSFIHPAAFIAFFSFFSSALMFVDTKHTINGLPNIEYLDFSFLMFMSAVLPIFPLVKSSLSLM